MNFLFDDDQEQLRHSTRRLIERRSSGGARRSERSGAVEVDAEAWRQGAALGWFSMLVPEALGGGSLTGQGLVDLSGMAEVWGATLAPGPLISTNVALAALSAHGTDQQQKLVPSAVAGESRLTWCVAEERAGWDPSATGVAATTTAQGLVLSGTKILVEDAAGSDHLLVSARRGRDIIEVLVPADAGRITIAPHAGLDLTRRLDAVTFDRTVLPTDAVLPGADRAAVVEQVDVAAVIACADGVGGATRVLDMTVDYTGQRVQFGRTIASFQAIRHRAADMLALVEGATAASRYAALRLGDGSADAVTAVDVAKAHVGDACATVTGEAIQLHGGIGFTWDHGLHLYARRARANAVLFGSTAWRRRRTMDHLRGLAASREG